MTVRARVAAAMRRLEVRIGKLLGPPMTRAEAGATRGVDRDTDLGIAAHTKSEFRAMAAHEDTVERVIANSTDKKPASRRKVVAAIDQEKPMPSPREMGR